MKKQNKPQTAYVMRCLRCKINRPHIIKIKEIGGKEINEFFCKICNKKHDQNKSDHALNNLSEITLDDCFFCGKPDCFNYIVGKTICPKCRYTIQRFKGIDTKALKLLIKYFKAKGDKLPPN